MHRQHAHRDLCLTEGRPFGKIFRFAFPLILTNLLQVCYNAADMIVVGRFSDVEGAVGAIGSTSALINLLINLLFGFSIGANVVVANAIGARDEERTRRAVHSSLFVGGICGLLSLTVGLLFSRPLLMWMDADPALLDMSVKYTRIYFLGVPFSAVLNYAISILRAKGDTKTPLYIMSASGVLNVLLNIFFVAACHMDVEGVALATAISNALSCIVLLLVMTGSRDWCQLQWRRLLHPDRGQLRRVFLIGLPAGIQGSLFSLSNVFIQRAVNRFGPAVITGTSIASNIEGIAYTTTNSIYQASLTFTGQNMGAGRYDRLRMVFRDCYLATFLVGAVVSSLLFVCREPLIYLYMNADAVDGAAIFAAAELRFRIVMVTYVLLAFMEVGSGLTRGMGKSFASMMISLLGSCVFRIVWIYTVFAIIPQVWMLYLVMPVSWLLTSTAQFIFAHTVRRRLLRSLPPQEALT